MTPIPRLLLFVVTLALMATACGDTTPSAADATDAAAAADLETAEGSSVELDADSPIEQLLGVPIWDADAANQWFRERDVERRRMTAECMLAEGFEYSTDAPRLTTFVSELPTGSREYAETHGFGIVAAFDAAEYDPDRDYSTENDRYLRSLTEPEAEAWMVALYGSASGEQMFDGPFGGSGGCMGQAFEEVFSVFGVMDAIEPQINEVGQQFFADPRMVELWSGWSTCMAEAGHPGASSDPEVALDSIREPFYGLLDEILRSPDAFAPADFDEPQFIEPEFVMDGDQHGLHPGLTAAARAELDDLHAEERRTAVASWDCHEPFRAEELAIQRGYEDRFVDLAGDTVRELRGG